MKNKTLTAVITSLLLAGGATSAMAYGPADSNQGQGGSAFSVIDRNGDGAIDRDEATASGISESQFEQMDSNGDGRVTESEYRNFLGSQGNR